MYQTTPKNALKRCFSRFLRQQEPDTTGTIFVRGNGKEHGKATTEPKHQAPTENQARGNHGKPCPLGNLF
jgi:hypothetical protein